MFCCVHRGPVSFLVMQRSHANEPNFMPLKCSFDLSFWTELRRRKLEDWKLDDSSRPLKARLPIAPVFQVDYFIDFEHSSFHSSPNHVPGSDELSVTLHLVNTKEDFEKLDRPALLAAAGEKLSEIVNQEEWTANHRLLVQPILLMFADLKNYVFVTQTCVPTFQFRFLASILPEGFWANPDFRIADVAVPGFYVPAEDGDTILAQSHPLSDFKKLTPETAFLVFPTVGYRVKSILSWELRNLLFAIKQRWKFVRVLVVNKEGAIDVAVKFDLTPASASTMCGWDPQNTEHKMKDHMDPNALIDQSVDLNLKLTRWRVAPELRLEQFNKKVCIIGAGTLGCNLARGLIGWGFRHITFVDYGKVSPSNPVRQSLYSAATVGQPKAEAAALELKRIYPGLHTKSVQMLIPMPGHRQTISREEFDTFHALIAENDIIFLATDSRESRWLPTALGSALGKGVFSVALSFDSFLIIRHGYGAWKPGEVSEKAITEKLPGDQLSCYFCSDVTAPGNSTAHRTLDQQCTISRSGLSFLSSGLAVELLVSVLQHPDEFKASAVAVGEDSPGTLGSTPHQIRGFLNNFTFMKPVVKRTEFCSACGLNVGQQVSSEDAYDFVNRVCSEPATYLESICGLTKLQEAADEGGLMEFSDSDE